MIDVSILIPHYDQVDMLEACLRSVSRQQLEGRRFEIIVADNNTPGGLDDLAFLFPDVTFLTVHERGAACARNAAMQAAQGKYFAFIDSDCIAAPGWLEAGLAALEESDLVGGAVTVTFEDPAAPTPVEAFEKVFGFRQQLYVMKKGFSVTANLFIRARDARVNGAFTNGLSEDVDWCHRARALGLHLSFNGKALVKHPARADWMSLKLKWQRLTIERWNTWSADPGLSPTVMRLKWLILAGVTALSAIFHMPRVLAHGELSLGQRLSALGVLIKIRLWRAVRMVALLARPPVPLRPAAETLG